MNVNHVKIGTVVSKHGYKGDIKINISSNLINFPDLKHIFIELGGSFIPFMIDKIRPLPENTSIVKLREIRSEKEVNEIIHKDIFIDSTIIELKKDSGFSYNDLINFNMFRNSQKIGRIKRINYNLPQPVFEVTYDSKTVLIPIHEDLIKEIDKKNKIIYLDIPDGLLEII